ncbi:hypothetical protein ACY2C7_00430 [Staphylococcus cohnii]|uniref:hypothetical protein n=1 Tax=Staphylococcus TaxID=1279 RepID=UPI001AEC2EC4|nr:hypothetical protein [Staphylococcus sp. GDY8P94P]
MTIKSEHICGSSIRILIDRIGSNGIFKEETNLDCWIYDIAFQKNYDKKGLKKIKIAQNNSTMT